ncbi:MAG: hypothetical protein IRZ04_07055 [Rhodospirillales bacterium]|nr:hypothetical protein [Rhodospirillales bacterium]
MRQLGPPTARLRRASSAGGVDRQPLRAEGLSKCNWPARCTRTWSENLFYPENKQKDRRDASGSSSTPLPARNFVHAMPFLWPKLLVCIDIFLYAGYRHRAAFFDAQTMRDHAELRAADEQTRYIRPSFW